MDSVERVRDILETNGFDCEVVDAFRENKVDWEVFTQLGKDDIKELGITALGDRKKLQQLITRLKNIEESMGNEYLTLEESNVSSPASFSTSTHSSSGCSKIGGNLDMDSVSSVNTSTDHDADSEPHAEPDDNDIVAATGESIQVSEVEIRTSIPSNVPDRAEGWEDDFKVPTQFSQCTMAVLASGKITKSAKAEIVQTTVSKMLNFCKYPTTAQQEVIAKKITADIMHGRTDSTGSGFGSWATALEMRFRSLRRNPRSSSTGLSFSPPVKKKKLGNHSVFFPTEPLDDKTYNLHVAQLDKQWSKKTRTKSALSSLMYETLPNRRKWILESRPSVSEILKKFPTLTDFDLLVADFASVTRIEDPMLVLKDNWIIWMPKISQKVKIESETHRKTYLPFLHILSECREKSAEEICEHPDILILFICLRKLLHSKMPKNHPEFLIFLENGDDIEKAIQDNDIAEPYMIQVGPPTARQWFIIVEKDILLSIDTTRSAILALMACYYIFDIAYPKHWNSCLLFIASFLLQIKGCPPLSPIQLGVVSDIEHIE